MSGAGKVGVAIGIATLMFFLSFLPSAFN